MPVTTRNQAKASNVNPRVETPVFSNANDSDTNTSDHAPPDSPTPEDVVDDDDPPQPTTHKEKGHKRSQSSISICNVSDPSVVQYFHGWQARMDALIEEAKQHGIDIYDEVRLVTEVAERSFAIVKSVEEYKKKNGNAQRDIKVVQFSGATTEDLQRLSWDKILIIDFDALLASVKLHIPAERHDKITSTAPDLRKVLEELEGFIGTQVEAGARISIDQWLIAAHRILKENVGVFVWTELRLSSAKSRPVYIEEEKGNKTTFLTGIIDYGLATIDSTNLSAVAAHILSISTQVPSNETVAALRGYHITFVIIEAKNDREDLQDHIPQVVLQCIALREAGIRPKNENDIIVFCLANSKQWIFGVIDCATKQIYRTAEVDINERDILGILLVFIFWASAKSGDILSLIEALIHQPSKPTSRP